VRTKAADAFARDAIQSKAVLLEDIPVDLVKKAQNFSFKSGVGGRIRARQLCRLQLPDYGERALPYSWGDVLSIFKYLPSYFSFHRSLWPFLRIIAVFRFAAVILSRKATSLASAGLRWLHPRSKSAIIKQSPLIRWCPPSENQPFRTNSTKE
jgi:hypothetical protein